MFPGRTMLAPFTQGEEGGSTKSGALLWQGRLGGLAANRDEFAGR